MIILMNGLTLSFPLKNKLRNNVHTLSYGMPYCRNEMIEGIMENVMHLNDALQ